MFSFDKDLLAFALLVLYTKAQSCLFSRYLLISYFCILIPHDEKDIFFLLLVQEGLVGLQITGQLSFFGISGGAQTWITVMLNGLPRKMNWDYYVIFESLPKFCILDSFVDDEGYSISSKEFLPTVVDIMVIWIKFTHSHPF